MKFCCNEITLFLINKVEQLIVKVKLIYCFIISIWLVYGSAQKIYPIPQIGHFGHINEVKFSNDGRFVISCSVDGRAILWSTKSGRSIKVFDHGQSIRHIEFSPCGTKLLTTSMNKVLLWNIFNYENPITIFDSNTVYINSVKFSFDGCFILAATSENKVKIWDAIQGEFLISSKKFKKSIKSASYIPRNDNVLVQFYDYNKVLLLSNTTLEVKKVIQVSNKRIIHVDVNDDGNQLIIASKDKRLIVWDILTSSIIISKKFDSEMSFVKFLPNGQFMILPSTHSGIEIWDYAFDKRLFIDKFLGFYPPLSYNREFVQCNQGVYRICDFEEILKLKKTPTFNGIRNTLAIAASDFCRQSNYLVTSTIDGDLKIWSLDKKQLIYNLEGKVENQPLPQEVHNGKYFLVIDNDSSAKVINKANNRIEFFMKHESIVTDVKFSPDGKFIVSTSRDKTAKIWDFYLKKNISVLKHKNSIYQADFSPNFNYLVTIEYNRVNLWCSKTWKKLNVFKGNSARINSVYFSPDEKYIITALADKTAEIWSISTGKLIRTLYGNGDGISSAKFSPDGNFIVTVPRNLSLDNRILIWNGNDKKVKCFIDMDSPCSFNLVEFSPNSKLLVFASCKGLIGIWDVLNCKVLKYFYVENILGDIKRINFLKENKLLIFCDFGKIVYDLEKLNILFYTIYLEENNWITYMDKPSNYYISSRGAPKMVNYVDENLKEIGFEQMDLILNRPDIILDKIGEYYNEIFLKLIPIYKDAWEKRIIRLGLDINKIGKSILNLPLTKINNFDEILFENTEGYTTLNISATDEIYKLHNFNIFINEVPLFGSGGLDLSYRVTSKWDTVIAIPLSLGRNKIQASVINEIGLESYKYSVFVNYTISANSKIEEKLVFIGIAVDSFIDSTANLNFCVKDIKDLYYDFSKYYKVDTMFFFNQMVTKNILQVIMNRLRSTSIHDRVIISVSSHGQLDSLNNFYFATSDMDFYKPSLRGISYNDLENLLDGIPARKKLMLIDACYSGERDLDPADSIIQCLEIENGSDTRLDGINSNISVKSGTNRTKFLGTDYVEETSSFQFMLETFINIRNRTGSTIIAAAGGYETALEGVKVGDNVIKNGAFTYSIREFIFNSIRDSSNAKVSINMLKNYVERRVPELTNGSQKPVSKQETMDVDWTLFK